MKKSLLISHEAAQRALEDALRIRVGQGKRYSFDSLDDASGVPSRTIRSYAGEGATPGLAGFLSLCATLGPSFTSDVLSLAGQSAASADETDPEHMRTLEASGEFIATLSKALGDGKVDHREAAQMQPLAQALIELLQPIAQPDTIIPVRGAIR